MVDHRAGRCHLRMVMGALRASDGHTHHPTAMVKLTKHVDLRGRAARVEIAAGGCNSPTSVYIRNYEWMYCTTNRRHRSCYGCVIPPWAGPVAPIRFLLRRVVRSLSLIHISEPTR